MIEDRTEELEEDNDISGLEETFADETTDRAYVGRQWEDEDGNVWHSFQSVEVWETNVLLSIEFLAPDNDFVELWDSMDAVLLVGQPILDHLTGEQVADAIGVDASVQGGSGEASGLEAAGVIDESTYESPNFGYEVTWTEGWTVTPENTLSESSYDQVQLMSEDGWVMSFSGGQLTGDMTVEDYIDELVASEEDSGKEILLDDADDEAGGYLAVFESEAGDEFVIYVAVTQYDDDGTIIMTTLIAPLTISGRGKSSESSAVRQSGRTFVDDGAFSASGGLSDQGTMRPAGWHFLAGPGPLLAV